MKTYKEIKTTLENLGLNVVDFEKLVQYIDIFPFERFIQDYSGPFVDANTQRYIKECNSNEIIALIEFDKNLSCLLLKAILFFENKFKKILVENWVSYYNMKSDKIYNFSDHELLSYMPNIKNCSDLKFSKFRYSLFEYASNSDFLQSYNSLSDIPIAELSYSWTFATSINFYRVMDDRIQKMILTKLRIKTDYANIFHKFLNLFLKIRNMISHNHIIYNFNSKFYRIEFNQIYGNIFGIKTDTLLSISLDKVYLVLDYLLSSNQLKNSITENIKNLKNNSKSKEIIIKLLYGVN